MKIIKDIKVRKFQLNYNLYIEKIANKFNLIN